MPVRLLHRSRAGVGCLCAVAALVSFAACAPASAGGECRRRKCVQRTDPRWQGSVDRQRPDHHHDEDATGIHGVDRDVQLEHERRAAAGAHRRWRVDRRDRVHDPARRAPGRARSRRTGDGRGATRPRRGRDDAQASRESEGRAPSAQTQPLSPRPTRRGAASACRRHPGPEAGGHGRPAYPPWRGGRTRAVRPAPARARRGETGVGLEWRGSQRHAAAVVLGVARPVRLGGAARRSSPGRCEMGSTA